MSPPIVKPLEPRRALQNWVLGNRAQADRRQQRCRCWREAGRFSRSPEAPFTMRPAPRFVKRVNTTYCGSFLGQSQHLELCMTVEKRLGAGTAALRELESDQE